MKGSHEKKVLTGNAKWRKRLFSMNVIIAISVFMLEVIVFFVLLFQGNIDQTLDEYMLRYLILPTVLDAAAVTMEYVVLRLYPENDSLQNYMVTITLILLCTVVATTHYIFANTLTMFCVPVMSSVVFSDKKLTNNTTIMSFVGVTIAMLSRYFDKYPKNDRYFIPNFVIAIGAIILAAFVARIVGSLIREQKETLVKMKEKATIAQEEALEANRAKSYFLANMSHEIRTPINGVLGMDEMILRETTEPEIREYALNIQSAGRSLLSIINDILDFSKIESGRMEIVPVEYEMFSLLNDSYNLVFMRAQERGLDLRIENDPTVPARIFGDEVRVRQIITNLLTNSVKYTEVGSVTLRVKWEQGEGDSINLIITVTDTGIGIKEEDIDKLFVSFQRVDEKHNRYTEGTGLGLTITKQLLDLMGGTITVNSEYGKGTTFTVVVPQKRVGSAEMGSFAVKLHRNDVGDIYREHFHAPNARILLVDDVQMNLKVMTGLLKKTQMRIDTTDSGFGCLELCDLHRYDIIFLDHMMPKMDGIETFRRLRESETTLNKDTPVVMLTANAISSAREGYMQEGFSAYLSKPVRIGDLEEVITTLLPKEKLSQVIDEPSHNPQDGSLLTRLSFLNTAAGLEYCANDESFYLEILSDYVKSNRVETLAESFEKQELDNYRINVHSIKSTSRAIGADNLADRALNLEEAAKRRDFDFITENHRSLMEQYKELLEKLRKTLNL